MRLVSNLRLLALLLHAGLAVTVAATLATLAAPAWLRGLLVVLGLLPLLATWPGLARLQGIALAWLAVALVGYAGFGIVEVVATGSRLSVALLLCALLELGLVLVLSRRLRSR